MTEDYIEPPIMPKNEDRTIRKVYLPIEVRNIILKHYNHFSKYESLTYGERALLRDFCNLLIWDLKQ